MKIGSEPSAAETDTASSTPPNSAAKDLRNSPMSPRTSARETPKMGVISGETSIAPMTTAGLFSSSPNAAMSTEMDNNR